MVSSRDETLDCCAGATLLSLQPHPRPAALSPVGRGHRRHTTEGLVLASSKTGEPRGIPLHDFVVPLFTALVERGWRLFRTPRGES